TGLLFPDKTIFCPQFVMGKFILVIEMSEIFVKRIDCGISYTEQTIFDPKSVLIIYTELGTLKFRGPVVDIGPVKKRNPFFLVWIYCGLFTSTKDNCQH